MFRGLFVSTSCLLVAATSLATADDDQDTLREILDVVESRYVRSVDRDRLSAAAIDGALSQLDPHCQWFPPQEADRLRHAAHGFAARPKRCTVRGRQLADRDDWIDWCDPQARIAYLRIDAFSADTPRELRAALFRLTDRNAAGLVIDLRFNRGGLLSAGVEVADLFLAEGRIVRIKRRDGSQQSAVAQREGTRLDMPLVLLVNRETASTAEVVAAALQDAGRADVAGERTVGKGSLQDLLDLPGGGILKLTTALLERPRGTSLDRQTALDAGDWGVAPNARLEIRLSEAEHLALVNDWVDSDPTAGRIHPTRDRQLEGAVQSLRNRNGE